MFLKVGMFVEQPKWSCYGVFPAIKQESFISKKMRGDTPHFFV